MNKRWMKSVIAASRKTPPPLPTTRGRRPAALRRAVRDMHHGTRSISA